MLGPEVGHLLSDARVVFYILTLGVLPSHRRRGLATRLVRALVEAAGRHPRARCVCLHVIHYNRAALGFYSRWVGERRRRYCCRCGRRCGAAPPGPPS